MEDADLELGHMGSHESSSGSHEPEEAADIDVATDTPSQGSRASRQSSVRQSRSPAATEILPDERQNPASPSRAKPERDVEANISEPKADDNEGWTKVVKLLKEYDTAMINGHTSDLDVLFIFAGLFSAVLTAFLVQSYTQLAPDNTMITVQLLQDISLQLQNVSMQLPSVASTAGMQTNFKASAPIVATNALWFLSLVFSLSSALLGIFVKQWTREYMMWTTVSEPHHAAVLRQYRYDALMRWSVPGIVAALPVLLQVALVLFFAGLLVLVWPLDHTVASIVVIAVGILLVLAVGTTVLPVFVGSCPYKTPVTSALPRLFKNINAVTFSPLRITISAVQNHLEFLDIEPFLWRNWRRVRRFTKVIAVTFNVPQTRSSIARIRHFIDMLCDKPRRIPLATPVASLCPSPH